MRTPAHSTHRTSETDREIKRRDRLREYLLALPYPAFEHLMMELLRRSGYTAVHLAGRKHKRGRFQNSGRIHSNGNFHCNRHFQNNGGFHNNRGCQDKPYPGCSNRIANSPTGSGGCDLRVYSRTDLATTLTVVQIKQYRRTVSRRFIDELRGTMLRLQATQGLLITTSGFSRVAQWAAWQSELAPIQLLDGNSVLDLLIQHRLGVRTRGKDWSIDKQWLDSLAKSATSGSEAGPAGSTGESAVPASISSTSISFTSTTCTTIDTIATDTVDPARSFPHARGLKTTINNFYPINRIGRADLPPRAHALTKAHALLKVNPHADDSGGPMLWRTHVLAGVSSLWLMELVPFAIGPNNISLLVAVAAFGSLLPDLDAAESKIKHLSIKGIKPFYLPAQAVHRHFAHRGFSHSLIGLALLALVAATFIPWWGWPVWLALTLGYASHLAADACTRSGIRWLFPQRKRYHLLPPSLRFVTGSQAEEVLFPLLALLVLTLLLRHLFLVYSF